MTSNNPFATSQPAPAPEPPPPEPAAVQPAPPPEPEPPPPPPPEPEPAAPTPEPSPPPRRGPGRPRKHPVEEAKTPIRRSKKSKPKPKPKAAAAPTPPPPPPAKPAPEPEEKPDIVLGQPGKFFTADEKSYVTAEMDRFIKTLEQSPANRTFVHEVILAGIELQRHDARVAEEGAAKKKPTNLDKHERTRALLMKRYVNSCEALNIMPKDMMEQSQDEETLSDAHDRYIVELEARRELGQEVGEMTEEAEALAKKNDVDPEYYRPEGVLKDEFRQEVVAEYRDSRNARGFYV